MSPELADCMSLKLLPRHRLIQLIVCQHLRGDDKDRLEITAFVVIAIQQSGPPFGQTLKDVSGVRRGGFRVVDENDTTLCPAAGRDVLPAAS